MEIDSVKKIIETLDKLKNALYGLDKTAFIDKKYGSELEFTYKGLLGGVESLMIDVKALINNGDKLLRITTFDERRGINEYLNQILNNLSNPNSLYSSIEEFKKHIRQFNPRYFKERYTEFDKELDSLLKRKIEIDGLSLEIRKEKEKVFENSNLILINAEAAEEKFNLIVNQVSEFERKSKELSAKLDLEEETLEKAEAIFRSIEERSEEVKNSLNEVKSNEKLITSFATNIQTRDNQLIDIDSKTQKYIDRVNEFENEKKVFLAEAEKLITEAKKALHYKSAEGISAAFQEKYLEEKNEKNWLWLVGASFCFLIAIGLGVWILYDGRTFTSGNINWFSIIGRITMLPFPILAALFCGDQYVKKYQLMQDYGYKTVLAKSIIGFSEEIKKDEGSYQIYMEKMLNEIHQDPLRKRTNIQKKDNEDDFESKLSAFSKIADSVQKILKIKGEI